MKKVLGLFALISIGVVMSGCESDLLEVETDVVTGSTEMMTGEVVNEQIERNDIQPLFSGYMGYYTDGVDVYWDENRYIPGEISLIKLPGVDGNELMPLSVSGSLSYRWLQHGSDLWMEDQKIEGIDMSLMSIEDDVFCGNSLFLSDGEKYHFISHEGEVRSWDKDNIVFDGEAMEYVTFGYQANNAGGSDDNTLLVFFTPDGAQKGFCRVIEIPVGDVEYQEISADRNMMGLSLYINVGETRYEVTSNGYEIIE